MLIFPTQYEKYVGYEKYLHILLQNFMHFNSKTKTFELNFNKFVNPKFMRKWFAGKSKFGEN